MDNRRNNNYTYLILILVLLLALYLTFLPRQHYSYPLHLDEWLRLGQAKAIAETGSVTYIDPFHGKEMVTFTSDPETGYHLFLAIFHQITGIPWLSIIKYSPSIIFAITILSIFIFANRRGFGWQTALFASLIPTTAGILGPRFMVPVSLGLLFIPLVLFLIFYFSNVESYLAIFLFMIFLLLMHAVTAVGVVLIVAPYLLLSIRDNYKHSLISLTVLVSPFLTPFLWAFRQLLPTIKDMISQKPLLPYVEIPVIINLYGYPFIALALIGVFYLVLKGGIKNYSYVFGLLTLLVVLALTYSLGYGTPMLYYRSLLYLMIAMSIVGGAGILAIQNIRLPLRLMNKFKANQVIQNSGNIMCLIVVIILLAISIPTRLETQYYKMIDEEDYYAFIWIRDNIKGNYNGVLDPWKGIPFAVMTETNVITAIRGYPKPSDQQAYKFINDKCKNTTYLIENEIFIVYTRQGCENYNLNHVRNNVYMLNAE